MRKYIYGILILICIAAYGCIDLEKFAQNNLYPVEKINRTAVPLDPPEGYQSINISGAEGNIHAYYYEHPNPNAPLLVYYHGNGSNLGHFAQSNLLKAFKDLEAHIVIPDYPGYGRSEGVPSELTLIPAALDIFDWAKNKFVAAQKTVVWGRSLGCAIAAQVTSQRQNKINSFMLTSPWNQLYQLMKHHFGDKADEVSIEWTDKNQYRTDLHANKTKIYGVIFHGDKDDVIPYALGQQLSSHYANVKFITLPGYKHNDIFQDEGMWQTAYKLLH